MQIKHYSPCNLFRETCMDTRCLPSHRFHPTNTPATRTRPHSTSRAPRGRDPENATPSLYSNTDDPKRTHTRNHTNYPHLMCGCLSRDSLTPHASTTASQRSASIYIGSTAAAAPNSAAARQSAAALSGIRSEIPSSGEGLRQRVPFHLLGRVGWVERGWGVR